VCSRMILCSDDAPWMGMEITVGMSAAVEEGAATVAATPFPLYSHSLLAAHTQSHDNQLILTNRLQISGPKCSMPTARSR
jgi:hypothetical protein